MAIGAHGSMGKWLYLSGALVALSLPACFLGYDSSWGQAKAAQQRLAASSTPTSIGVETGDPRHGQAKRTYRIRLRPNAHYLAQTVDAERQLRELVEDANRVLESGLGLELEVETIKPWSFDDDDRLDGALKTLAKDDAGQDVDVVVGLIGALPRPTESLHEVGLAELLGKHIIVRASSRLGEHDAVDRAMPDLDDDARDRVVRARRRHRAEAVFLHEVGHAMTMFRGGNAPAAYEQARSLFAAYPDDYAVQDLRCQLATVRWLDKKAMLAECGPVGRLADAGASR
jgi:hypothetical protein